jgi:probable biosynthetic protein (TIGR04098 family)
VTKAMAQSERVIRIGMPQMALGYLSENWLLKELGSLHWDYLCSSMKTKSNEVLDSQGRRLYATFVRVRVTLEDNLSAFDEGDDLHMSVTMSRFGRSSAQSAVKFESNTSSGTAILLSTFSFRTAANNTALAKSEPRLDFDDSIRHLSDPPIFLTEYSAIRKQYGKMRCEDLSIPAYRINPYSDSNGANLLYFASYQSIHDFLLPLTEYCTKSRDIFYFKNCNLTDSVFRTPAVGLAQSEQQVESNDILFRGSDGESIAFVSTLKERG